ncbi:MAG: response regulator transcription factor [Cyclobacteriaceae bacterium]
MAQICISIVEDEFTISEDIRSLLLDQGYNVNSTFASAEEAQPQLLNNPPDLLLADIRLSGTMTGIQLVGSLKKKFSLPVVYITASSDPETYAKAKATMPNAFLIKPFTHSNLLTAIDLALANFSLGKVPDQIDKPMPGERPYEAYIHKCLFIRSNGKHKKICSENIHFVEAAGSYVHIQTDGDRFTLAQNLNNFLKKTPLDNVLRVHRSYVININKVDSFDDSWLFIKNHKIPISDTYKSEFLARIHCL